VDAEIVNAWSATALDQLPKDAPVLLAGSGLTAIDICLSLLEIDHTGTVYMVSRHGYSPGPISRLQLPLGQRFSSQNLHTQSVGFLAKSEV
jgi:uncharacterized NAD(P)/FAD-binding protein YdhS